MCATINILQNLPRGALIRAVLLLSSEEYSRYRKCSCTTRGTRDTAVLQEVQDIQLYLILVQERGYSRVYYKTHRRILQE